MIRKKIVAGTLRRKKADRTACIQEREGTMVPGGEANHNLPLWAKENQNSRSLQKSMLTQSKSQSSKETGPTTGAHTC